MLSTNEFTPAIGGWLVIAKKNFSWSEPPTPARSATERPWNAAAERSIASVTKSDVLCDAVHESVPTSEAKPSRLLRIAAR
jgi:hypothetical protein